MCVSLRATYRAEATAVATARHWAVEALRATYGSPVPLLDSAGLVVSELATNCVEAGPGRFEIDLDCHHGFVTVRATDDAPGTPVLGQPDQLTDGGRGLVIVAALADEWGVDPAPVGKTVWAELAVPTGPVPSFGCSLTR